MEQCVGGLHADQDGAQEVFVRLAVQMTGEQFGEPPRDALVGVVRRVVVGRGSPEVDEEKPGTELFIARYSSSTASMTRRQSATGTATSRAAIPST